MDSDRATNSRKRGGEVTIAELFAVAGTVSVTITPNGDGTYSVERRRMRHGITGGIVVERFEVQDDD